MGRYIVRRLLLAIPTLFVVSLAIFSLLRLLPGDVVIAKLADSGYVTPADLHRMRDQLGLDRPFLIQYLDWVGNALRGNLGQSLWTSKSVMPQILSSMKVSSEIAILAIVTAVLIAIPLGVLSAVKQNTWIDYVARLFAITGQSVPDFWLATMLLLLLSRYIGWLPNFGWYSPITSPVKNIEALIFPALIIGYRFSAVSARLTRSTMLEVLRNDYIRTARAKGLPQRDIIFKHGLRNALIPVITILGTQITVLIGGLVIIEQVFSLPGLGSLTFDAVIHRDYPIVQGSVLVMATVFVFANLAVDLSYGILDPRIRYS